MSLLIRSLKNTTVCLESLSTTKRLHSGGETISSNVNVPGLSSKVVSVPNGEVGPGASKNSAYKNPEYFCYDKMSYFDAEIEMSKYRMPQPSNKK